jgi:hypothetical protein
VQATKTRSIAIPCLSNHLDKAYAPYAKANHSASFQTVSNTTFYILHDISG